MNGPAMADQNDSKKSPEDTYGSTKSLNSDDENSPPIPDITHGEETQPFASNPTELIHLKTQSDEDQHAEIKDMIVGEKDSNPSPGASNDESTHSLNLEPEPKTWCCVLVGTKCKQILEDVPLLLANGSQLRAVFELDEKTRYHIHLLTLVILSLVSYIFLVFFTIIGWYLQNKHNDALNSEKKDQVENDIVKYCCCCTKKYHSDEYNESDMCQCPYCHVNVYLTSTCYILVFITICANIGITGIGIFVDC
ncbi:uncharacterized protein [Mytilus edulis]|uniref:uncharacterized protein isoform X2 n=1 Tax=Mytilus edulis TaxID=6550 RepID=UPI0039F113AB